MARKPLQFQVPEKFREEIEDWVKGKEITLSEFLRQSVRLNIILRNYAEQGYKLVLRKEGDPAEKEIILS
jgi:hypothetical protein